MKVSEVEGMFSLQFIVKLCCVQLHPFKYEKKSMFLLFVMVFDKNKIVLKCKLNLDFFFLS